MVEGRALIFGVESKVDRLRTQSKRHLKIVDICYALTEVQRYLVKDRLKNAETTKKYRHELRPLEVKEKWMPVTKPGETSIIKYPDDYLQDLGIRIRIAKRGCGKKEIDLTKIETGDKNRSFNSSFWKTSYAWEQVFGDEGQEGVYVYNGTDCKTEGMIIDYYQIPPEIHVPSQVVAPDEYIDWNGKPHATDSGWFLDDLADEGINLAAMVVAGNIGDMRAMQTRIASIMQTDQISKL